MPAYRSGMKQLVSSFAGLRSDERGATAIEYALIAGFISIAIVTAATQIGVNLVKLFSGILPGLEGS
ncbi:Flp family type IVb pilin [Bosea thiooxidans]